MLRNFQEWLYRMELYRRIPAEDEFSRQQFILFRIFSLTGALVCLGVFTKMKATIPASGITPWLIISLGAVMLLNLLMVAEVSGLRRAYLIMMISACALLHTVAYDCGGIMTGGSMYWAVIIIYAYLLLGKKTGSVFAVLIALHMVYLFLIRNAGMTSFALFKNDKELISEDFLVNGLLVTYLISSLCNYLQSGRNVVVQGLQNSKNALEIQNKLLEEKNQLLNEYTLQLEITNRELEKFASVAAHDLKAPLRAIGNTVGMLEQDNQHLINTETKSGFDLIKGRVNRMEGLLNGLLRYAKIGRTKKVKEEINPEALIHKIFVQLNKSGNAELAFSTKLPCMEGGLENWTTLFTELLHNSFSFCDKEQVLIRLSTEVDSENKSWIIYSDNGPGIPSRYHEKVFLIFQTLNARDEKESSGIGLALVKKLAETEGSQIQLTDSQNGVRFKIYIPERKEKNNPSISESILEETSSAIEDIRY